SHAIPTSRIALLVSSVPVQNHRLAYLAQARPGQTSRHVVAVRCAEPSAGIRGAGPVAGRQRIRARSPLAGVASGRAGTIVELAELPHVGQVFESWYARCCDWTEWGSGRREVKKLHERIVEVDRQVVSSVVPSSKTPGHDSGTTKSSETSTLIESNDEIKRTEPHADTIST